MLVVDWDKSERGSQKRRAANGRPLHACCMCPALEVWGATWTTYCSMKDEDDEVPIPKFCSEACRQRGGRNACNVTEQMKRDAKDREWREPERVYREATAQEKYSAAADEQKRARTRKQQSTLITGV